MDQTVHSLKLHVERLNLLCRICGRRSAKSKEHPSRKSKVCEQYADYIKNVYGIDVNTDSGDIHSANICHKCYARSLCIVKAMKAGANPSEKKPSKMLKMTF